MEKHKIERTAPAICRVPENIPEIQKFKCIVGDPAWMKNQASAGGYGGALNHYDLMTLCSQYFKYGKAACLSQRISEKNLIDKTKEVLDVSELNRAEILDKISRIIIPEHHHMIYELKDGTVVDVHWAHPSRSLSWTAEMREAARQKALNQQKKGGK